MPENDGTVEIVVEGPPQEREKSMPIDLNELLIGAQAHNLNQVGQGATFSHVLLDRIAAAKFDEPSMLEAAATKEIGKTGAHTDPVLPVARP